MDFDNIDDERLKRIVREELDHRAREKQQLCGHIKSGTLRGGVVYCDTCDKALDETDLDNAYTYTEEPSVVEDRNVVAARSRNRS
jgi:hypothetical protein